MDETPVEGQQMYGLRLLRWLVTGLTATMMIGLIVLIWLFVTRFPDRPDLALPDTIALPDGTAATAFTRGPDWLAVVTDDQRILIYDAKTVMLRQEIRLISAP